MPELPEVETIRRDLTPLLEGRAIVSFAVLPGAERLLGGAPEDYVRSRLVGQRLGPPGRRGKYLLLPLFDWDSGEPAGTWIIHLRMTGSLRHRCPTERTDKFLRALIELDDGSELRFVDIRKFGTFEVVDDVDARFAGKLGPEPLTADFDVDALWSALRGRRTPVKAALLDQANVAGLGNIYVDEALFLAHLHPQAPAGSLRPKERAALTEAIERVLRDGIANRGASFRDYTDGKGAQGSQQYFVRVFRRTGQACDECGAQVRRSVVGGRSSHWCPKCQPAAQQRRQVRSSRPRKPPGD